MLFGYKKWMDTIIKKIIKLWVYLIPQLSQDVLYFSFYEYWPLCLQFFMYNIIQLVSSCMCSYSFNSMVAGQMEATFSGEVQFSLFSSSATAHEIWILQFGLLLREIWRNFPFWVLEVPYFFHASSRWPVHRFACCLLWDDALKYLIINVQLLWHGVS